MAFIETKSVEINVSSHCNLRCRYCDQWSPFWAEEFLPLQVLERDLAQLAQGLRVDEFKILGGEPLLNPDLPNIVASIRASGIARTVSIITNGLLLDRMAENVWTGIDRLRISLYPGVKQRLSLKEIGDRADAHGVEVLIQDHISAPFRLTSINQRNDDDELVKKIYASCADRNECNTLHHGRFYACTSATFFDKRMARLGLDEDQPAEDYVAIHEVQDLSAALRRYLDRPRALNACRFCLGSLGKAVPADQGNREKLAERLAEDHSDVRALLNPVASEALWPAAGALDEADA